MDYNPVKKLSLIEHMTDKILSKGSVSDREIAEEIARRWICS